MAGSNLAWVRFICILTIQCWVLTVNAYVCYNLLVLTCKITRTTILRVEDFTRFFENDFTFNTAVHQNTQDSLSSQESSSSQKDENKKAHAAFEHSRDQRIQTAKQGNARQSNPTKTGNNASQSLQVAGNQVFSISCYIYIIALRVITCKFWGKA